MKRLPYRANQRGVSDVIGTMLLLSITVVLFTGVSFAVMEEIDRTPPPANAEFRVDTVDDRTTMSLVWGESLGVDETKLIFDLDGVKQSLDLTQSPLAQNIVHRPGGSTLAWDVGEPLRLTCAPTAACAYPGRLVENITVVQSSVASVIFSTENGIFPGAIVSPVADLAPIIGVVNDPARSSGEPLYAGGTFVIPATIANSGLLPTPTSSSIIVEYFVDGSGAPSYTFTRPGTLAAGASFAVQNPAFSLSQGTHSVRVHVESSPAFAEATLTNNDPTATLNVVAGVYDPGLAQPYEDGNDDNLYNPYSAGDVLLAASAVTDGVHTTAANKGLVIPPSMSAISVSGNNINFAASRNLHIGVDLETTASNRQIILTAGGILNLTGTVQVRSADALSLVAGGKIDVSGDSLDANDGDDILLISTSGPIRAVGTNFYIVGLGTDPENVRITVTSGNQVTDLQSSTARVDNDIDVDVRGPLYVKNVNFEADDDINLDVNSNVNVYVQGAFFADDNDCADVDPSGATITGTTNPTGRASTTC